MKIPLISRFMEKRQRKSDMLNPKQWLLDALGVRELWNYCLQMG